MFWVMVIKPFVGLVLFGLAYCIAGYIMRFVPHGWLRRLLTRQVGCRKTYRRWRGPPRK